MKPTLFVFILLLLFNGCASNPTVDIKQKPLPQWIMNPPQSDSSTLYGIGEGKNKQDALNNALNEMVATLSVSLASQFNTTTKINNFNGIESYSQETESNIQSKVKELRISNYELLQYEKIGFNKYAVLVKAQKKALFNTLKDEVDKKILLLKNQENSLVSADVLKKLQFYKNASLNGDDLVYRSLIMKVLENAFHDDYIIKEVQHYKNNFTTLQSKISFSVNSDDASTNLIPAIKEALSSKGFKITNLKSDYHLNVNISSLTIEATSYGFHLARSAIEITIKDNKNQTLSTKKLNITGQSTQGYQIAKENIAYKLQEYIHKDGIGVVMDAEL